MFNSETLEVGIGMAFLFLLMSLICTAVKEGLEGLMKWRAKDLEQALRTLLDDTPGQLTAYVLSHPLISSLFQGKYDPGRLRSGMLQRILGNNDTLHMPLFARRNLPSYIPSDQFAKALLDIVARGPVQSGAEDAPQALSLEQLRERAAALTSPVLRRVVLTAIDHAEGDLQQATNHLQHWFDSAMDRASGWYKRRTQTILFALGLGAAIVLNVDSLYIMGRLTLDKTLRDAVVSAAAHAQDPGGAGKDGLLVAQRARQELDNIGMPIGWIDAPQSPLHICPLQVCAPGNPGDSSASRSAKPYSVTRLILGWLISALAVMLGAPFWFDVLNKFMVLRSSVKPREKAPDATSKDQADAAPGAATGAQNTTPASAASPSPTPGKAQPANTPQAAPEFVPHSWRDGLSNTTEIAL